MKTVCVQRQKVCKCAYFVFALVTATERALHGVAALHSDLSPHHDSGGRLFGAFHNKTAAAHAEGRGDLGQDFRKSLGKTQDRGWRSQSGTVWNDEVPVNKRSGKTRVELQGGEGTRRSAHCFSSLQISNRDKEINDDLNA